MLKKIIEFINSFIPYINKGKNNNIYIVIKGKEKKLKRRIKGLTVKFYGNNNIVKLHLPIRFYKSVIRFDGDNSKFEMHSTNTIVNETGFSLEDGGQIFIDRNSQFNRPNVRLIVNNHTKNESTKIHLGKNAQISIDVLMRTSDGHSLFNFGEKYPYNKPENIIIGDNVWLGSRVVLLKGTNLPNNSVVGACSVVNKNFREENVVIAGNPAKIIKHNTSWNILPYGKYIESIENSTIKTTRTPKQVLVSKLKRKKRELLFKTFS